MTQYVYYVKLCMGVGIGMRLFGRYVRDWEMFEFAGIFVFA